MYVLLFVVTSAGDDDASILNADLPVIHDPHTQRIWAHGRCHARRRSAEATWARALLAPAGIPAIDVDEYYAPLHTAKLPRTQGLGGGIFLQHTSMQYINRHLMEERLEQHRFGSQAASWQ